MMWWLSPAAGCELPAASWREGVDGVVGERGRGDVTYDGRALIINGTRVMLFSGEIHYPRSSPE
uniref:Uncharacterized protein n=1 Tax=Oryza brachyantha TaxID=4533 RepID=J3M7E5_ORYBR